MIINVHASQNGTVNTEIGAYYYMYTLPVA